MTLTDFIHSASSLFSPQEKGLLAISGGLDSTTLLHLMHSAHYPIHLAHCNFHLRGADSDADEAFVRSLAQKYQLPLHVAHFDTRTYARTHHLTIEEAARNLRYAYFQELLQQENLHYIATAHHADDNIETLLLNLLRSSGLSGLTGIPPRRGPIVRPLLPFTRAELQAYAQNEGLTHREDHTNALPIHRRNRIRHQLLPLLTDIDPHAPQALLQVIQHLRDADQVYQSALDAHRARLLQPQPDGSIRIPVPLIDQLHPQRTLLFELLRPYGYNAAQVDDLLHDLHRPRRALYYSPTYTLLRTPTRLTLTPR